MPHLGGLVAQVLADDAQHPAVGGAGEGLDAGGAGDGVAGGFYGVEHQVGLAGPPVGALLQGGESGQSHLDAAILQQIRGGAGVVLEDLGERPDLGQVGVLAGAGRPGDAPQQLPHDGPAAAARLQPGAGEVVPDQQRHRDEQQQPAAQPAGAFGLVAGDEPEAAEGDQVERHKQPARRRPPDVAVPQEQQTAEEARRRADDGEEGVVGERRRAQHRRRQQQQQQTRGARPGLAERGRLERRRVAHREPPPAHGVQTVRGTGGSVTVVHDRTPSRRIRAQSAAETRLRGPSAARLET